MLILSLIFSLFMSPCEFEDSNNCYWAANVQGNGSGVSFIDIMGTPLYLEGN